MKHFGRCFGAISPVLAVLMMIAIAVAGSLVTYAWAMGYIDLSNKKAEQGITIHSIANRETDLLVYVQNVGEGVVQLDEGGCLYVNDVLVECTISGVTVSDGIATIDEGKTAILTFANGASHPGEKVEVKVTTLPGGFTQYSDYPAGTAVAPPVLDHFAFDKIESPQNSSVTFTITIRAVDQYGKHFASYIGVNTLTCSGGEVNPTTTGGFLYGIWTGEVTVIGSATDATITTVAQSNSSRTGTSNVFEVIDVPVETPSSTMWNQYHGNAEHDGAADSTGPTTATLAWSRDMLVPIQNPRFPNDGRYITSETQTNPGLLVVDDVLIVTVPDLMYKYIYGLDPTTGDIEYTGHTTRTVMDDPTSLGSVYPASDGEIIYFGDYCIGCYLDEGPWLVADYASDGSNVWIIIRNDTYTKSSGVGWELLTYYDDMVYSAVEGKNLVQAFDSSTGIKVWSTAVAGSVSTIPTAGPEIILVGYSDQAMVTALDAATGEIVWSFNTDNPVTATPACCVRGNFFFGTSSGKFYCISADGNELWSTNLDASVAATPAIAAGKVFVSTEAGSTYAFGALTGELLWHSYSSGGFDSPPVVSTNGILYEVTASGEVYAIDITNGVTLWSFDIGENVTTCPALYNGTLYIADTRGVIYAFNDEGSSP